MQTLLTLSSSGVALEVLATCPVMADHWWRQRRELVRLAGAQRLQLTIELPDLPALTLTWAPPPLPAVLAKPSSTRRRARYFQ